jgi:predicted RNA-binding Zn-ribbon protein involved in translation (DUF1610 family)
MTIGEIAVAVSALKSATEIASYFKNIDNRLEVAEMRLKAAELIDALADAKIAIAEIKDLLTEKDEEIKALSESLSASDDLQFERGFYWKITEDKKDRPFCPNCWDSNKKIIRIHKHPIGGFYHCSTCGANLNG